MATNDIVKKIVDDAVQTAGEIFGKYENEANEILKQKESELEQFKNNELERIAKESENYKRRLIQIANLDIRKKFLSIKQEIVDDLFKQIEERILNLPDEKYLKYIETKIIEYIQTGNEEVVVGTRDKERINQAFLDNINKKLKEKLQEEGHLKISSEPADFVAGFVLVNDKIRVNNSIEYVLKELREEMESSIVNDLFKE